MHKSSLCFTIFAFLLFVDCSQSDKNLARSTSAYDCSPIDGAEYLDRIVNDKVIIFGELHGTNEGVQFVSEIICDFVQRDIPVKIGFEAIAVQGPRLDAAAVQPYDRARIEAAAPAMWSIHDGRSSQAIERLIIEIADWRSSGADIEIFAFEPGLDVPLNEVDRAIAMAGYVDEAARDHEGAVVVISGVNLAANSEIEMTDDAGDTVLASTMPRLLTEREPFSLRMVWGEGSAWRWTADGPSIVAHDAAEGWTEGDPSIRLSSDPSDGYDAEYIIREVTASAPAFPALPDSEQ